METFCKQLGKGFYDIVQEYTETSSIVGIPGSVSTRSWTYFTLKGLTLEQKLPAINEIFRFKNKDQLKDTGSFPKIYLPDTIIKKR